MLLKFLEEQKGLGIGFFNAVTEKRMPQLKTIILIKLEKK